MSCYLESEYIYIYALISMCCSALQCGYLSIQNFSTRGFVFQDRLNPLDRQPRPKSFHRTGLRSRFPMRAFSMLQEERPLESRISPLILTLTSRGFVFLDRLNTLKLLRCADRSCRFWILRGAAAQRLLWICWHRLASSRAMSSLWMKISCLTRFNIFYSWDYKSELGLCCNAIKLSAEFVSSQKTFETLKIHFHNSIFWNGMS